MQDALGRESELEQKLGMAQYGQQMAEAQIAALGTGLQQRDSLLEVCTHLYAVFSSAHAMAVAKPVMTSLCNMRDAHSQAFQGLRRMLVNCLQLEYTPTYLAFCACREFKFWP